MTHASQRLDVELITFLHGKGMSTNTIALCCNCSRKDVDRALEINDGAGQRDDLPRRSHQADRKGPGSDCHHRNGNAAREPASPQPSSTCQEGREGRDSALPPITPPKKHGRPAMSHLSPVSLPPIEAPISMTQQASRSDRCSACLTKPRRPNDDLCNSCRAMVTVCPGFGSGIRIEHEHERHAKDGRARYQRSRKQRQKRKI